jgi:DNA-binding NtrC family response regulator
MSTINLLIVDDELRFLETTAKLFEKRGVRTHTATNGVDALKILETTRIDVVLLDMKMPGMDGLEILRRVKQKYPLIEIIMLTGYATVETAVEGLRLGAFDYIMKPSTMEELQMNVEQAFERKHAAEEKIRKAKIQRIISHPMAIFQDGGSDEED